MLVVVDEQPAARRALRRGAALASAMRARLIAVRVETPQSERSAFDVQRDLQENLAYATDLGAQVVSVVADDLVAGIVDTATRHRATQVVLAHRQRGRFDRLRQRSIASLLIERDPSLEVHLVGPGEEVRDAFSAGAGET